MKAMADIKDQINRGNKPAVPDVMGKYISIEEKEGNPEVYCIYDKWQIDILTKRIDIENAFNHFLNFSQRGIDTGE